LATQAIAPNDRSLAEPRINSPGQFQTFIDGGFRRAFPINEEAARKSGPSAASLVRAGTSRDVDFIGAYLMLTAT
jgi:hypothetical protein